uniref:Uncharacterized protein n=1 Tax=Strigamia maritima TaxID=126957 RepID=T1JPA7_STRMM
MHLHFERAANAHSDCAILSFSWMGKVPDEIPEDDGWKLNRTNYYQEGWLASGNMRGVVGVTFTTCHCNKLFDAPLRTNYNLRGHRSEKLEGQAEPRKLPLKEILESDWENGGHIDDFCIKMAVFIYLEGWGKDNIELKQPPTSLVGSLEEQIKMLKFKIQE